MPKPVPIPVRQKLLQRAQLGESTASLAAAFGLAPRTVRHLKKRFRDRGPEGIPPDYRTPKDLARAYRPRVRERLRRCVTKFLLPEIVLQPNVSGTQTTRGIGDL